MNIDLLQELTEAHGVSGREDAIREIVKRELAPLGEITSDAMGNVICTKKGSGSGKKVMLAAHMDQIGFLVNYIGDTGYVHMCAVGGIDNSVLPGTRVTTGVTITFGTATAGGWSARVTHPQAWPIQCAIFFGSAPAFAPATSEGLLACQ